MSHFQGHILFGLEWTPKFCSPGSQLCSQICWVWAVQMGKKLPSLTSHNHDKPLREIGGKRKDLLLAQHLSRQSLGLWGCGEAESITEGGRVKQSCLFCGGHNAERRKMKGIYPSNAYSQWPASSNQISVSTVLSHICILNCFTVDSVSGIT